MKHLKKITLIVILLTVSLSTFSQESSSANNSLGRNELKLNMTNLIIFKWVDVSYEHLLNDESSFGVGLLVALNDQNASFDEYRSFSLTPYYRQFFSREYAQGFFVEAFSMIHSSKISVYDTAGVYVNDKNVTDLAVGISSGFKVISRRGFAAEVYLGIGRDLLNKSGLDVVTRGGVSIGYRF